MLRFVKLTMWIPSAGRVTFPSFSNCLMIFLTSFAGIAKPRPSTDVPPLEAILLYVIPITCPWILIKGPPELPGLMAVSVWIAFVEIA